MSMQRHHADDQATDAHTGRVEAMYVAVAETADGGEDMIAIRDPETGGHVMLVCPGVSLAGVSALVESARQMASRSGRTARVVRFTAREDFASFGPEPEGDRT